MISTFSAINATVLGSSRVNYNIAKDNELPHYFCHQFWGKPVGLIITAILSLILVNTFNLESISTAGSAGFLFIFAIINYIGTKKNNLLHSKKWIHTTGFLLCSLAFLALITQQFSQNKTGVIISLSIILGCFIMEFLYKKTVSNKS